MWISILASVVLIPVVLIVGKIFVIPLLNYLKTRHLYADLPRAKSLFTALKRFMTSGGVDRTRNIMMNEKGVPYPLFRQGIWFDGYPVIAVADPEGIKEILLNEEIYGRPHSVAGSELLGKGLVSSSGALWKRQRRLITPIFHFSSIEAMVPGVVTAAQRFIDEMKSKNGEPVYAPTTFSKLTLRVIIQFAFGGDFDVEWLTKQWDVLLDNFIPYFVVKMILGPLHRVLPWGKKVRKSFDAINRKAQEVINERRNSNIVSNDLIGKLLSAKDEDGNAVDDAQIIDEARTFLFAGHDTTSNLLAWSTYFVGRHPDVQKKLQEEVDSVLQGNPPTPETLSKLKYVQMTLQETLRMRGPVEQLQRRLTRDVELLGEKLYKGTHIAAAFGAAQYNEAVWKNAESFIPERFSDEEKEASKRHEFVYLPFSGGPRNCIGKRFALQEAKTVLAMIIQNFRIVTDPNEKVVPAFEGTITPKGLHVRFVSRG